ncbi:MAG: alpha/beta hydrolase [Chloroflexi bacterium]|nr:alpha/beta hydrolase [Chloroflexota bacterium]
MFPYLLLLLFFVLMVVFTAGGLYFALLVVRPKCFSVEETYRIEIETGKMSEAEWLSWERQEVVIPSPFGYDLFGVYLPLAGADRTVIIAHGITYTLFGSVKYVNLFRRRGFNVLLYDHRNHGRSGGRWSTFGYYEKHDLAAWMAWAKKQLTDSGILGVMGESFGAAVAIQCLGETPGADFLVCDCSFSDLTKLLAHRLQVDYHLPAFPLLPLASLWSRVLTGMAFEDISPLRDVAKIAVPCLFIHGLEDKLTPARMSEALYAAKTTGIRSLYLAPRADHAMSFSSDPQAYEAQVSALLDKTALVREY